MLTGGNATRWPETELKVYWTYLNSVGDGKTLGSATKEWYLKHEHTQYKAMGFQYSDKDFPPVAPKSPTADIYVNYFFETARVNYLDYKV